MDLTEIKSLIDNIGRSFESYKNVNDARLAALQNRDFPKAAEHDAKLTKIEKELQGLSELKSIADRLEDLESRRNLPGLTGDGDRKAHNPEYSKAFDSWIRKSGKDPAAESIMMDIERKDITVGSSAGGGYALPKEISQQVEKFELRFSPVRSLVKVVRGSTTDFHYLLNLRGTTSGWVSETGARSASNTPQLRDIVPTFGELYAYPQISNWALQDLQFDPAMWLAENIADEFALQEGIAALTGNGSSKFTGMLATTPVATLDNASPVRAAAAYAYVASVASPFAVTADSLMDLVYALNSTYRANATFIMNSTTTGAIRKLKDSQLNYLWAPGLGGGQPDRLLGYPTATLESLDDIGSVKFPVAFGDWKRAYLIVDRQEIRIIRDEVTNPGFTRFYASRRSGAVPLNNDSAKWIRTA